MKKIISIVLAGITVASALASCAPAQDRLDSAITLASSDATECATWLDERLDAFPTEVIVGIGSNEAYGIDMSDFEDDGYILRSVGNDTLVFGASDEGLDRAVRAYAKAADAGAASTLSEVYHEGYRIEKLTVAGRDISEYTVTYNYDRDSVVSGSYVKTFGNAKYAAEELVRLIEQATGVTLNAVPNTEKVTTPVIAIDYYTKGDLGENGFTYEVKDGNLYINGVTDANGCVNGVYYLLQYECGWDFLMYGDSELREADLVDIPEGTSAVIDPMFDFVYLYDGYTFDNERSEFSQKYHGIIEHACHGMQNYDWSEGYPAWYQICYTSKDRYLITFDNVLAYIEKELASGKIIGETLTTIDISQGDNLNYCTCKECVKVYKEEGNAHSGAVVRFANRLSEEIEAEGYGGLVYQIFAYHGSNIPCITPCRDDIFVTVCNDGSCQNHLFDGSECTSTSFDMAGVSGFGPLNNKDYSEWLAGWGKICKNLYLWHYAMDHNMGQYTYFRHIYPDFQYFLESNVRGIFYQQQTVGIGLGRLRSLLVDMLIYNPHLTEAEYNVLRDDIMRREYGDGYEYILAYIDLWEESEYNGKCWNCWGYSSLLNAHTYDIQIYSANADEMIAFLEKARLLCDDEAQEKRIKCLILEVVYRQCATTYFKAYDANDTETIAHLKDRYELFKEYTADVGFEVNSFPSGGAMQHDRFTLQDTLEGAAWTDWVADRSLLTPAGTTQREAPYDYDHVVIVGVDGAGTFWNKKDSPFVTEFFADGFSTTGCRVANPTISIYNWTSLMSGVNPQVHGVSNSSGPYTLEDYPSIFKLLYNSNPEAKMASISNWPLINKLSIENGIGVFKMDTSMGDSTRGDLGILEDTLEYLESNTPELLFVCFDEVDYAGHYYGVNSAKHKAAVRQSDGFINEIFDVYEEKGIADETLFIVTADHGHKIVGGGHGGQSYAEKYVTFFAKGKTIAKSDEKIDMNIRDIPAIVTHALCIEGNEDNWDSLIPKGLFTDMPEGQPRHYYSTEEHVTVETPAGEKALENYVDTAKLESALFFDGDLTSEYGSLTPAANEGEEYVDGYYGSALNITQTQHLAFDEASFGAGSFSIGLWVKEDVIWTGGSNDSTLYGNKSTTDTVGSGFIFRYAYDSEFNLGTGTDSHSNTFGLPDDFDEQYWYHTLLVVDRDEGTVSMYYNFKLNSTHDISRFEGASLDSGLPFVIGADGTGSCSVDVLVDDFLLFNDALTDEEIDSLCSYYFE